MLRTYEDGGSDQGQIGLLKRKAGQLDWTTDCGLVFASFTLPFFLPAAPQFSAAKDAAQESRKFF